MADENIGINVELSSDARKLKSAIESLEAMGEQLGALGKGLTQVSNKADKMARSLTNVDSRNLEKAAAATERIAKAQAKSRGKNPEQFTGTDVGTSNKVNDYYTKQRVEANIRLNREAQKTAEFNKLATMQASQWTAQIKKLSDEYGEAYTHARALAILKLPSSTPTGAGSAQDVAKRMGIPLGNPMGMMNTGITQAMADYRKNLEATLGPQRALVSHLQAEEEQTNRLTNARYAMFAAGASLAAGSYAVGAAMLQTVKAAMDYETALAQISRTSGMTGIALQQFSGELRDMASTIPIAFADISEIATLGGQLNISKDNLGDFTTAVAQFGMTTNVQAGTAAEAFGRLNGLLPDVNDNYDALGSSILNVGVNSVATESDIIGTATQIAAVGSQAGFSADEVIGFAAAMRSVGINPYLSRGGLTRIFGVISNAIAEGGASLNEFAALSGRSADSFQSDWRDDAATTFIDLLKGMEGARQGGEDLYQTMNRLGVVNSQDRQVLAVLSQNYDELTSAIGYANEGFTEGTQLQSAFDIQAGTLASKIQMLVNSLHGLFGVLASNSLAAFSPLVTGMTLLATSIADLVTASPVLQTLISTIGAIATVGAGIGIVSGAMILFTAAVIAGRTAMRVLSTEIEVAKLAMMEKAVATAQSSAVTVTETGAVVRSTIAQTGLGRALSVTAQRHREAAAATAAYTAATGAQAISNMTALKQVLIGGADGGNRFTNALKGGLAAIGPWAAGITIGVMALEALRMGIESTQATAEQYTTAMGESANATRLFTLANQGIDIQPFDLDNMAKVPQYLDIIAARAENVWSQFGNIGQSFEFDNSGFTEALSEIEAGMLALGDNVAMREAFVNFAEDLNLSEERIQHLLTAMPELSQAMITAAEGSGELEAGMDGVITQGELFELIMSDMANGIGVAAGEAMVGTEAMYYLADSAAEAGGELQSVADTLATEFAMPTMLGELGAGMRDFAMGIAEGGMIFSAVAAEGQTNVANFQAMVGSAIVAGQSQGLSAAQSVDQLFAALKANGMDVMAILGALRAQGVQSMGGISMANLARSASTAQTETSNLGTYMNTVYKNAMQRAAASSAKAGRSMGGGGGGKRKSPDSLAGGAQAAKVEVRSLVDYANDLRKVMDRAFDIRFGSGQAMDKIAGGWAEIAEKIADATEALGDANQEIAETQAKMAELTADRSIKQYFLSIAEAYGDVLRGDELRAELLGLDADLGKEQKNLADAQRDRTEAQDEMAMSLTGDSEAARENRSNVLGLVESYQGYLLALASSGTSQSELQSTAAKLKDQFMKQGLAAGFSADELGIYSKAFDDYGTIVARVPWNVNVGFNADPALQAMAEFDAEAAAAASNAGARAGRAFSDGFGGGVGGGGGIGGIDIPWPELPPLPIVSNAMPKVGGVDVNDGTRVTDPRGGYDIYDPTEETNFIGGKGTAVEEAKGFWETFWETLNGSGMPTDTPVITTSIGHAWAGAVARGMSEGTAKGSANAVKAVTSDFVYKAGWSEKGDLAGGKFAAGQKAGWTQGAPASDMLQKLSAAPWSARGDQTGSSYGSGQKLGYERAGAGSAMVGSLNTKDWQGGGRTSGNKFGTGTKAGFDSANPVGGMTGAVAGAAWYGHGSNAGGGVGSGLKAGFDSQQVSSKLQNAVKDGNWYTYGHTMGKNIGDGMKAGFNNTNAAVTVPGGGRHPVKMYREGGFTGTGNPNQIAGMVHKNEFVMPASATRNIGLPALEAMRKTGNLVQGNAGMQGIVVVEFSAYDRELIAASNNVQVVLSGGQIAAAASAANIVANNRGSD